jgi:hypothetical protein
MKRSVWGLLLILATAQGTSFAQDTTPSPSGLTPPRLSFQPAATEVSALPASEPYEPSSRIWGSADYLLWWVRRGHVPPLVVTGSTADPFPGALDQPGTQVLFGWLDRERRFGVEAGGFMLEHRAVSFSAAGDANGQPFLATPFVNANTGNQNVYFISQNFADPALTALLTGSVGVVSSTNLWSWELSGVANLARNDAWTVDFLGGFRQTSLRENFSYVTTASNIAPGGANLFLLTPIDPGFSVTTFDGIATRNTFNGAQLGARLDRHWGRLTIDIVGKLGLGSMHEAVNIQGQTTTNAPLPVTQAVGGIYAQQSNIGTFNRDVFAVIPEIGVNLSFQLKPNIIARVGYTFLYMSNVLRPGDQIDPQININRVAIDPAFGTPGGPDRPAFNARSTGFWAQGINFGLEIRY